MKIRDIAIRIAGLVDAGVEYPEAEWMAVRHLAKPPSGPKLVAAYEDFRAEELQAHWESIPRQGQVDC
jgi:hypothetical protein